ncbi:MAG: sigma-54-dependent Fis family transcriptional regulator, partial [Bdellovibrionaceae bacterium]|nr:sigma-54-dependent Fis family transcriptional regulator [Pseudobdellovibrionaceae bacterium]
FNINVQSLLQSKPGLSISKEALSKLKSWHWPGNISELECVIERAAALAEKNQITEEHIIFEDVEICVDQFGAGMTLSEMEKRLILQTLQITSQNKTKAARMLGISIRTLRNKLNEYRHGGGV